MLFFYMEFLMSKKKRKPEKSSSENIQPKVAIVDLGCAKNTVDSEILLGRLLENGFALSTDINNVDLILVNTCGFIESSRAESIENLQEAVKFKAINPELKIVAVGCMAERYKDSLLKEVSELDGILGLGAYDELLELCNDIIAGKQVLSFNTPDYHKVTEGTRLLLTGDSFAYLRIADGCDNRCSYCAVPLIRGRFRSRSVESIIEEARGLLDSGIGELDIIAQDITCYGKDTGGSLQELLENLLKLDNKVWYRLLYAHPAHMTDGVIDLLANEKQLLGYLDLPIQHINDRILAKMGRFVTKNEIVKLIEKLRKKVNNLVLRTSVICGFPGETDEEFKELTDFIKGYEFEHLGAFAYSREADTTAYNYTDQVSDDIKMQRLNEVMTIQQDITFKWIESRLGKKEEILLDGYLDDGTLAGRSRCEAPDVDGVIFVKNTKKRPGDKILTCLKKRNHYDIMA